MNHVVRQRLVELVARYGHELGLDGPRLRNSLRELCPGDEHKRAIAALTAAAIEGAPVELLRPPAGVPTEALLARLSKRLYDHRGLDEGLSRWAVESWALSLGVISSDQLTPLEMPAGQPPDAAAMADGFRNAVRRVAVNGTLQKAQVEMLNDIRRRLGLDKAVARRIFDEETKRANATVWRRSRPNELPCESPQQAIPPVLPPPPAPPRAVAPPPIQYSPASGQPTGAELKCPAASPANVIAPGDDDRLQRHEAAKMQVRFPSLVLMLGSTFGAAIFAVAALIKSRLGDAIESSAGAALSQDSWTDFVQLMQAGAGAFVAFAALRMMCLKNYRLAFAGALVATVPCTTSCGCLATPFGLWAVVLLLNPGVISAFTATAAARRPRQRRS